MTTRKQRLTEEWAHRMATQNGKELSTARQAAHLSGTLGERALLEWAEAWLVHEAVARRADFAVKADTAYECAWAVELRWTPKPNSRDKPDRSTVFFAAGAAGPSDGLARCCDALAAELGVEDWLAEGRAAVANR
jgi:hypothetical protein